MTGNLPYYLRMLTTVSMYVLLAMGLNVTLGLAGLLDMGYIGFYAVGAYTYSLLSSPQLGLHLPLAITLPASVLASVILSLVIGVPTLRLHGDYLAIVTMGFAEIIRILLVNLDRPVNITNGPNGIIQVDPISFGPFEASSPLHNFLLISAFAAAACAAYVRLSRSNVGLKWKALKDDPIAASSLGINTGLYRILAFVTGSVFAGTAGALFAGWQGAVFPQNFTVNELIVLYCMVILGGAGNPRGTIAGAAALVIMPELLRGYSVYRMLLYGAILVLTMIYKPQGLLSGGPPATRLRTLMGTPRTRPDAPQAGLDVAPGSPVPQRPPILSAKDITVTFGGVTALRGVSCDLAHGEVLSIIGPNGAGKTTLVNVLTGVTRPERGEIYLDGALVTGLKPYHLHRLGLSRTFQNNRLFDSLTVAENLSVPGGVLTQEALGDDLQAIAEIRAESLSYGHRKSVEMARALAGKPKVVLLDEPAAGMNPAGIERIIGQVKTLKAGGYSVILVEHRMPLVMSVSDRIVVLDQGQIVAEGTPAEVAANPRVADVYLGQGNEARAAGSSSAPQVQPLFAKPSTPVQPTLPVLPAPTAPTSGQPLLELRDLNVCYGPIKALHGVSLSVRKGEVACILGNNGAGKSTTLKAIMGAAQIESGSVLLDGRVITGARTESLVGLGVAVVPEGRRLFGRMTVDENLAAGARPGAPPDAVLQSRERVFELFPILKQRLSQRAGTLSGGEQQMLAISRALMSEPSLLLLDEPSMGLAPVIIDRIMGVLRELNRAGLTVLMVEQNALRALEICQDAYVLENGTVVLHGNPGSITGGADLKRAYLGYPAPQS